MITPYLLFFFAGLGAFNGVALAGFLLWRQPATSAQRWLAMLILMVSIRTGKSVLFYFWPEISRSILQVGLTACFLIGPCLLGFTRAWAYPDDSRTWPDAALAAGLLALAVAFGVAFPYASNENLWSSTVWPVVSYSWLICVLASVAFYLRAPRKPLVHTAPDGLARGHAAAVIAGVALIWLAYFTAGLTSYIVGALSFSLVLYLGGIVILARRRVHAAVEPYKGRKITSGEAGAALQALHSLMVDEELYRDASLSLGKVARRLNMPVARLSQLLNDNNNTTFKQYLAQLRVDAAKRQLRTPDRVMMEHVAESSGFLSMSAFYSTFKKMEGTTPASWRNVQRLTGSDT